ncbi:MAG: ROK family protein [Ancalomicrobiaceae bacterium]|nr:ROK family protein [Ancalomicrobiaceae bacterium]
MKTADPELMRAINRLSVVDTIRRFGPISRVEICEHTELSPTTVSAITAALLDDALIIPTALGDLRDEATRGRPRVQLALNPDAAHVVGVRLTPDQITVATTNFRADVLESLTLPVRLDRQPAGVIADLVEDGVRRSVADANLPMSRIAGVCIGLPGIVARDAGICRRGPVFSEANVPLGRDLADRLSVPVTLDVDVNLAALAEHWFGRGRDLDDFLVITLEQSLGLGVIHRGEVFRIPGGLSPDLGDVVVAGGDGTPKRLGSVASLAAILDELGRELGGDHAAITGRPDRSVALARDGAEAGDAAVAAILARAGTTLGIAIANLISLFAPPRIILTGLGIALGRSLLDPLRQAVRDNTPDGMDDVTEIVHEIRGEDMWARGAAAMMLRDLYGAPWNTTGPAMRRLAR